MDKEEIEKIQLSGRKSMLESIQVHACTTHLFYPDQLRATWKEQTNDTKKITV